jgi:hypothetical protein
MIPWDHMQGQTAVIVGIISACVVWLVIGMALYREKRYQSKNSDDH